MADDRRPTHRRFRARDERGSALLEAAVTIPLLLALSAGIFEFGRAFQTWQVLTNAAREGARMAVVPNAQASNVTTRVRTYMQDAQLANFTQASVAVNRATTLTAGTVTVSASEVTIDYPYQFMVLQPVMNLLQNGSLAGAPITMRARVQMRNESQ